MTGQPKILIVEDETSVAMMMVFLLTRAGCEVQSAWKIEKVLELAKLYAFDLVTLDVNMSGANGFDVCRRLRQISNLKDTPVIFVTGCVTAEDRQRAFEFGATDFIEKPFDSKSLVSRVLSQLEGSTMT